MCPGERLHASSNQHRQVHGDHVAAEASDGEEAGQSSDSVGVASGRGDSTSHRGCVSDSPPHLLAPAV